VRSGKLLRLMVKAALEAALAVRLAHRTEGLERAVLTLAGQGKPVCEIARSLACSRRKVTKFLAANGVKAVDGRGKRGGA
jgi:hypothetical protein